MSARPILFSGPMVCALLAGRKTQTRRAVKPRHDWHVDQVPDRRGVWRDWPVFESYVYSVPETVEVPCPYGQPGDELWVRETWSPVNKAAVAELVPSRTREDHESKVAKLPKATYRADHGAAAAYGRWHPSIHMPRWASRITLRVTSVRVERLQEISEADAMAEGIESVLPIDGDPMRTYRDYLGSSDPCEWFGRPRDSYRSLWESINGAGSWAENPWVWVISVERET